MQSIDQSTVSSAWYQTGESNKQSSVFIGLQVSRNGEREPMVTRSRTRRNEWDNAPVSSRTRSKSIKHKWNDDVSLVSGKRQKVTNSDSQVPKSSQDQRVEFRTDCPSLPDRRTQFQVHRVNPILRMLEKENCSAISLSGETTRHLTKEEVANRLSIVDPAKAANDESEDQLFSLADSLSCDQVIGTDPACLDHGCLIYPGSGLPVLSLRLVSYHKDRAAMEQVDKFLHDHRHHLPEYAREIIILNTTGWGRPALPSIEESSIPDHRTQLQFQRVNPIFRMLEKENCSAISLSGETTRHVTKEEVANRLSIVDPAKAANDESEEQLVSLAERLWCSQVVGHGPACFGNGCLIYPGSGLPVLSLQLLSYHKDRAAMEQVDQFLHDQRHHLPEYAREIIILETTGKTFPL